MRAIGEGAVYSRRLMRAECHSLPPASRRRLPQFGPTKEGDRSLWETGVGAAPGCSGADSPRWNLRSELSVLGREAKSVRVSARRGVLECFTFISAGCVVGVFIRLVPEAE